jgi:hypothetical protein
MDRPAFQGQKRDQALTRWRQLDGAIAVANGETAKQVEREVIRHLLIVEWCGAERPRRPLLVFWRQLRSRRNQREKVDR